MADHTKNYAVSNRKWLYPPKHMPPTGVKLHLLTIGGISVHGNWSWQGGFVAWQYLFKRDEAEETKAINFIKEMKK